MTDTTAHWATQQDQSSGGAAAIRAMLSDDSAVQWIALSGCRICEAQFITHGGIDLARKVWTIPAQRTNANRDHVVPITDAMAELLFAAAKLRPISADCVFVNKCSVLRGVRSADLQGVRTAFSVWAKSDGKFPPELIHAQLGHRPSAVGAANSRKSMMEAWATYLMGAENV